MNESEIAKDNVIFIVSGKISRNQLENCNLYVGSSFYKVLSFLSYSEDCNIKIEIWENGSCLRRLVKGDVLF